MRKAPKQVWLAVGDNGLTVFAEESVLETLHYAKMKSWSPGFQGDTLTLLFVLGECMAVWFHGNVISVFAFWESLNRPLAINSVRS